MVTRFSGVLLEPLIRLGTTTLSSDEARGNSNTTGDNNTIIGNNADVGANNLNFATAIGSDAVVSTSNTVVLGRSADTVLVPGNFGGTDAAPGSGGYIVAGVTTGANVCD